jgi:hypothetical protein
VTRASLGRLMGACVLLLSGIATFAQAPAPQQSPVPGAAPAGTPPQGRGRGGPAFVSPEIGTDGRVTFRVLAPQATVVTVGGDINGGLVPDPNAPVPAAGPAATPVVTMAEGENGVWTGTTVRAVKPGAWRYTYNVDGAPTVDIRNTRTSPNQTQVQSLLVVPGDFAETRDVPHGAVAAVHYVASALRNARREMVVYTPPGYEKSTENYPVLYLIHGGGDTAISWSTVGRANDIVDNLIAEKKALPMIVVMPSGWTPAETLSLGASV